MIKLSFNGLDVINTFLGKCGDEVLAHHASSIPYYII